ncbi:hypothetical protein DRO35_02680 [Candidatus Bathyarchaeota archaeon]|nr:MAG: hypothetical protein DRO35_02680 [Candidatus Bathyarchaeota archaeon]
MLVSEKGIKQLYGFAVKEFKYRERSDGYVSKCHLCVDIRKHIVGITDEFKEIGPKTFYEGSSSE